jgi:hypothetical protein
MKIEYHSPTPLYQSYYLALTVLYSRQHSITGIFCPYDNPGRGHVHLTDDGAGLVKVTQLTNGITRGPQLLVCCIPHVLYLSELMLLLIYQPSFPLDLFSSVLLLLLLSP